MTRSDGAGMGPPAISGDTVVAPPGLGAESTAQAYVFTEPPGGWAGTLHESALLISNNDRFRGSAPVSIEGRTVVVGGTVAGKTIVAPGEAEIFTEPAAGWSGTVYQRAVAPAAFYPHANEYVYTEPRRGWSGTLPAAARLVLSAGAHVDATAISGNTISIVSYTPEDRDMGCACPGHIWLFSKPTHGWANTLTAAPSLPITVDQDGTAALGLTGQTLFAGGQPLPNTNDTALGTFKVGGPIIESVLRQGPPVVTRPSLTGLADGEPVLEFRLRPGSNAPALTRLILSLPSGLRFATGRKRLASGIGIPGYPYTLTLSHGRLTIAIRFDGETTTVTDTIGAPALTESTALRNEVRRIASYNRLKSHRHKKLLRLRITAAAVDAAHVTTRLTIPVTVR